MVTNARDREFTDEAGVSLIELLVTILIVGVIMSAITIAVVMGLRSTATAEQRLDRSNIAEFAARYFTADAVSSNADQTGATPCPGAGTALTILRDDGTIVSYAAVTAAGRTNLVRRTCGAVAAAESEIGSSRVIGGAPEAFQATGTCPSSPTPPAPKVSCSLTVTWADGNGGDFTLSGTRRSS